MSTKLLENKRIEKKLKALTTARHAYIGLHGFAYDRAKMRRDQAGIFVKNWFETFVSKGEEVEVQFNGAADTVKTEVSEKLNFKMPKLSFKAATQSTKVAELEAEIKRLSAELNGLSKPAPKKAAVKKTVKKTTTIKTEAPKTEAVKTEAPKATTTATKTAPDVDKYAPYLADVQRFDTDADMSIVRKIVIHCGIALRNNDGRYVACSDETERQTVRNSWLVKKLGLTGETAELDAKVQTVCDTMKSDNKKNRVTFYYLLAKNEGKLASL